MSLDRKQIIDARDALNLRLESKLSELSRLQLSLGGNWKKQRRIMKLIADVEKLEKGVERLENMIT